MQLILNVICRSESVVTGETISDFWRNQPEDEQRRQVDVAHHGAAEHPVVVILSSQGLYLVSHLSFNHVGANFLIKSSNN